MGPQIIWPIVFDRIVQGTGLFTPRKESLRFKKIVAAALLLIILDGFVFGLPAFGLFIRLLISVASAVASMIFIFSKREFAKLYAGKCLVCFCACMIIVAVFRLNVNDFVGKRNAHGIIETVHRYQSDKGVYPATRRDLVPVYISSIPVSAYRLSYREYRHSNKGAFTT